MSALETLVTRLGWYLRSKRADERLSPRPTVAPALRKPAPPPGERCEYPREESGQPMCLR
jgi:hypothetical protein